MLHNYFMKWMCGIKIRKREKGIFLLTVQLSLCVTMEHTFRNLKTKCITLITKL